MTCRYSEEHIEQSARLYRANPALSSYFLARGVAESGFALFVDAPGAYLAAAIFGAPPPLPPGTDYLPLLPAQRAVAQRQESVEHDAITTEIAAAGEAMAIDRMGDPRHVAERRQHRSSPPRHAECPP